MATLLSVEAIIETGNMVYSIGVFGGVALLFVSMVWLVADTGGDKF